MVDASDWGSRLALVRVDLFGQAFEATVRARGQFAYKNIEIDTGFRQAEDTLAHEVGHAVDTGTDRPSGVTARGNDATGQGPNLFEDDEVLEEARELSKQSRGRELDTDYLESQNEVFADLFAEATTNPRRAKKEAPKAFRKLNEAVGLDIGYF